MMIDIPNKNTITKYAVFSFILITLTVYLFNSFGSLRENIIDDSRSVTSVRIEFDQEINVGPKISIASKIELDLPEETSLDTDRIKASFMRARPTEEVSFLTAKIINEPNITTTEILLTTTEPEPETTTPTISPETIFKATKITFQPGPYLTDTFDFKNNKYNNFSPEKFRMQQPEQFVFYEKLKDQPEISWAKKTCRKNGQSVAPKRVVYLKTHKTGSTGIRDRLYHYCLFNNYTKVYTKKGGLQHLGGYPAIFNATAHLHKLQSKVDCLVDHVRWNKPELVKVLNNYKENESHIFIGSIRDPLAHSLSSFSYWYSPKRLTTDLLLTRYDTELLYNYKRNPDRAYHSSPQIGYHSCDFEPYRSIFLGDLVKDQTSYVKNIKSKNSDNRYVNPANLTYKLLIEKMINETNVYPQKLFDGSLPDVRKIRNMQSSEFNYLSPEDIFKQFDMIIILERMAECLVLLVHRLCTNNWRVFQYLYAQSRDDPKKRKNSSGSSEGGSGSELWDKYFPEEEQRNFIKKYLLDLDLELYRQANLKLDQEIEKFGREKMEKEIYQNLELPYLEDQRIRKRRSENKIQVRKKRLTVEEIERRINDTSGLVWKPEIKALMDESRIRGSPEFRCGFGFNQYTKKPVEKKYYRWFPEDNILHGTLHVKGLDPPMGTAHWTGKK